jgi:hypothetical protein
LLPAGLYLFTSSTTVYPPGIFLSSQPRGWLLSGLARGLRRVQHGRVEEDRQSGRGVTVDEAARHLGLTVDAVRKRVQRGQIAYEKGEAGRVRIVLDEGETLRDDSPDNTEQTAGQGELVEELRDHVHSLERMLEEEREARTEERRRHDTLMAQLMQRIPKLEAPSEASEPPETADEQQGRGESPGRLR